MNRPTLLKIILPLLLAVAIALGLVQRASDPYFSRQTFTNHLADNKSLLAYYNQAQSLAQTGYSTTTATFLAVGDIMLSRNVAAAIQNNASIKGGSGPDLPFEKMADILRSTNFNFANLESPIVPPPAENGVIGGHSMVFGAPAIYAVGLKDYNFKIVNLANNHALDQGIEGMNATCGFLDSFGLEHEGTGNNLDEAWQPAVVSANGIKICFIGASYASVNDGGKTKNNFVSRIEDLDHLNKSIAETKAECDFTVVTMHAGVEYTRAPNATQINFAHAAIDGGADIVIGAHPHWVQTIEKYQNKYIFYSLGNFIFDQMWSQETREGLTLKITVSKNSACSVPIYGPSDADKSAHYNCPDIQGPRTAAKLDSIELLPVIIENYSTPRPATAEETKNILNKIGQPENILK